VFPNKQWSLDGLKKLIRMIGMIPNKLIDNWLLAVAIALYAWTVAKETSSLCVCIGGKGGNFNTIT